MTMQCIYYLLYIIVIGSVIDTYKVEWTLSISVILKSINISYKQHSTML